MYTYFKRVFDIFFSVCGLIVLSPLFIMISGCILITDGFPIFFRQERCGKNWRPFKIYKFRSMINNHKSNVMVTSGNDNRITKIGRIIRRTKLDELPQLINVLKGEMSFVGPRPEVFKYAEIDKAAYDYILKIKPGITDYASIRFRNEETILAGQDEPEKYYIKNLLPFRIKLYKKYVDNFSFGVDVKILLSTFCKIIR